MRGYFKPTRPRFDFYEHHRRFTTYPLLTRGGLCFLAFCRFSIKIVVLDIFHGLITLKFVNITQIANHLFTI